MHLGISSSTHGMKLKFVTEILLDKKCCLITSWLWSRDPLVFYRPKIILADISRNEKWPHQRNYFAKGSYWQKFQVDTTSISKDIAWLLFFPIILSL